MKNFIVTHLKQIILVIGLFVVLISTGVFIHLNKSNSRPETKIILDYENSGGFAGVCDHLKIFSDYRFFYEDACRVKKVDGELNKEEVSTLNNLIKQFGVVNREWDDYKERGIVDGFAGRLKFYGKNQRNTNQNQEQIGEFAQNIIERIQVVLMKLKITVTGLLRTSGLKRQDETGGIKVEKISLRGVLQHADRPTPDIGYDYELRELETQIVEQSSKNSWGSLW